MASLAAFADARMRTPLRGYDRIIIIKTESTIVTARLLLPNLQATNLLCSPKPVIPPLSSLIVYASILSEGGFFRLSFSSSLLAFLFSPVSQRPFL